MQSAGREPSMEDILASIKKVIAEEKELRGGIVACRRPPAMCRFPKTAWLKTSDEDVLELVETLAPPADLGPPLVDEEVAGAQPPGARAAADGRRHRFPRAPPANPLEDMVREMLRPILKQWLDDHLPAHGRRACEARNLADHRPAALGLLARFSRRAALLRPAAMTRDQFMLLAAAAAALAASPLAARPMTAKDMHVDAPPRRARGVARRPVGRCSLCPIPTLPRTSASTRCNLLDLTATGAKPQPARRAQKRAMTRYSRPDGSLWFLMGAGDHDQLFRMKIGGGRCRSATSAPTSAGSSSRRRATGSSSGPTPATAPTSPARQPASRPSRAGSGRTYDQLFVRHWDTWAEPGRKSRLYAFPIVNGKLGGGGVRLTGALVGDTPSKPFGGGEEIAISPGRQDGLFRAARGGADRAAVDQSRHLPGARRRQRRRRST